MAFTRLNARQLACVQASKKKEAHGEQDRCNAGNRRETDTVKSSL
jgi:hypothetical protein